MLAVERKVALQARPDSVLAFGAFKKTPPALWRNGVLSQEKEGILRVELGAWKDLQLPLLLSHRYSSRSAANNRATECECVQCEQGLHAPSIPLSDFGSGATPGSAGR